MQPRTVFRVVAVTAILTVLAGLLAAPSFAAPPAREASGRYLVLDAEREPELVAEVVLERVQELLPRLKESEVSA